VLYHRQSIRHGRLAERFSEAENRSLSKNQSWWINWYRLKRKSLALFGRKLTRY